MQRLTLALLLAAVAAACTDSGTTFTFDAATSTTLTPPVTDAGTPGNDGAATAASSDGGAGDAQ